ncbi:MAG: hypothetical protein WKG07_19025 [Hymenobacter sp.]
MGDDTSLPAPTSSTASGWITISRRHLRPQLPAQGERQVCRRRSAAAVNRFVQRPLRRGHLGAVRLHSNIPASATTSTTATKSDYNTYARATGRRCPGWGVRRRANLGTSAIAIDERRGRPGRRAAQRRLYLLQP